MNRIFNYDFLKLEFRDIYEDIEELKKKTTHDDIEENINTIIDDIIYYICKQNNILYDENVGWLKRLDILKEVDVIPNEILQKIILWSKKAKSNEHDYENDQELIEMKLLYEVLVWFVINYGNENYSLFISDLFESEKEIFKKYLKKDKGDLESKKKIESNILEKTEEEEV